MNRTCKSDDLMKMARAAQYDERLSDGALYGKLADEIDRLSEAKRAALKLADERAKEAVELRAQLASARKALEPFALDVGAVSLGKALGHITREHLLAAKAALTS